MIRLSFSRPPTCLSLSHPSVSLSCSLASSRSLTGSLALNLSAPSVFLFPSIVFPLALSIAVSFAFPLASHLSLHPSVFLPPTLSPFPPPCLPPSHSIQMPLAPSFHFPLPLSVCLSLLASFSLRAPVPLSLCPYLLIAQWPCLCISLISWVLFTSFLPRTFIRSRCHEL